MREIITNYELAVDEPKMYSALRNLIEEFRMWNNEWEKYDNKESKKKPKSVDDFMNDINEKYVVGYTHCG